ncbi:ATP-dependent helicase [Natronoglycomyces albus]|uniref:DNA 3'-5' helicase n=1 Tax=Natronoglycomyces albus TaxID=2811108 RepID=A0A895XFD7_9ACTN|nr:ATP-dependent DNA helicase [Natronoglycomyces albus]QSB04561.1 ATP-dependent helicase [Natronoglycomyces albus]
MSSSPRYSALGLANRLGGDSPAPTEEQRAVIEAGLSPMLVIAGAGSGKTSTMADRVVWLIACGLVKPEHILGLTFTRKAAAELTAKIRTKLARLAASIESLDDLAGEPTVSTYNAYAASLVTEHGIRIGIEPGTHVITDTGRWQMARDLVCAWDGELTEFNAGIDRITEQVLALSGGMSEHLVDASALTDFDEYLAEQLSVRAGKRSNAEFRTLHSVTRQHRQLLPLVKAWQERKRDSGVMDFADQLQLAEQLVSAAPEVAATERERWHVVLLDEYQDTSHSQVTLLRKLFGDGHAVCAVGDPNQSIYSWRGASAGTLERFRADFPTAEGEAATEVFLTRSWRNRAEILEVANTVSEPLRSGGGVPQLTAGVDGVGVVATSLHATAADEAAWVAEQFSQKWWPHSDTGQTAATLVRSRRQIAPLMQAFDAAGLPFEVVGSVGLLYYPEVAETVATLRATADPTSGAALLRLLTGPRIRLGPRDMQALWARARELVADVSGFEPMQFASEAEPSLSDALNDLGDPAAYSPSGYQRLQRLQRELSWLRERCDQSLADIVRDAITVTGLDVETLLHRGELTHLDDFVDVAASYDSSTHSAGINSFLSYLETSKDRERGMVIEGASVTAGVIQIMTVHAAKGLEWDVVAVPGLAQGVFPSTRAGSSWVSDPSVLPFPLRGDAAELPMLFLDEAENPTQVSKAIKAFKHDCKEHRACEERRLAYVAMTRARHTLLASAYYWEPESVKPRQPAAFLSEARLGATEVGPWLTAPGATNPLEEDAPTKTWPVVAPLGHRQESFVTAARLVDAAMRDGEGLVEGDSFPALSGSSQARYWRQQAALLLAEREERARNVIFLRRPERMSASQVQAANADPQAYLRQLRRPLPQPPHEAAGRGTDFHAWVEEHFQHQQTLPLEEFSDGQDVVEPQMERWRRNFEASQWAQRDIHATEVPFVIDVDGIPVRGRIDAVFARQDGRWDVVDWKTGRVPIGEAAVAAAAQLAIYRVAWARLAGVDESAVEVAFYYVADDVTVRPADLPSLDSLSQFLRVGPGGFSSS